MRTAMTRKRAANLLEAKDVAQIIASLSPYEAYYAVKELGLTDAVPLLGHLTREQIGLMFDLDTWRNHALDIPDVLYWLESFGEAGREAFARAARSLDPEALAVLLRRRLFITLKPKEDRSDPEPLPEWASNPPEEILPIWETPDGRFLIAARAFDEDDEPIDEEERKAALRVLRELYLDHDFEFIASVLRLAETDVSADLEETAYRFRNARAEDLGFPPLARAIEIYGALEPTQLQAVEPVDYPRTSLVLPAVHAEALASGLLHEALDRIADHGLIARIEGDLVPVANQLLVADGIEPGNLDDLRDALTRMKGYIELALAFDTDPTTLIETAVARLQTHHVKDLFRIGYTMTLKLKTQARVLKDDPRVGWLSEPERDVLEALSFKRPRFALTLQSMWQAAEDAEISSRLMASPGFETSLIDQSRPFLTPRDHALVSLVLDDIAALFAFAAAQEFSAPQADVLPPPPESASFRLWFATATANVLLGREFAANALTREAIADLADKVRAPEGQGRPCFDDASTDRVRDLVAQVNAGDAVARRAAGALGDLSEALWPLVGVSAIDLRFVDFVLCRTD